MVRSWIKKGICGVVIAAMLAQPFAPLGEALYAYGAEKKEAEEADKKLSAELRTSVDEAKYPNGVFELSETMLTVNEGDTQTVEVLRAGNTDKEATVVFKAADISASSGRDYRIIVKHSALQSETLEGDGETTLLSQYGEVDDRGSKLETTISNNDTEETVEDAVVEEAKNEEASGTVSEDEAAGRDEAYGDSPLAAAYKAGTGEEAPAYDWKEYTGEEVSDEVKDSLDESAAKSREYLNSLPGVTAVLTFAPGEYKKEIKIETIDDDLSESDEQILFVLQDAEGAEVGETYNGYLNILDNDETEETVYAVREREITVQPDEDRVSITVERLSGTEQMGTVMVGTKAIDAEPGADYAALYKELFFGPGVTEKTVEVEIKAHRSEERSFYIGIKSDNDTMEEGKNACLVKIAPGEQTEEVWHQGSDAEDDIYEVSGYNGTVTDEVSSEAKNAVETHDGHTYWYIIVGARNLKGTEGVRDIMTTEHRPTDTLDLTSTDRIRIDVELSGYTKRKIFSDYTKKTCQVFLKDGNGKTLKSCKFEASGKGTEKRSTFFYADKSWEGVTNATLEAAVWGLDGNTGANSFARVIAYQQCYQYVINIENRTPANYYTEKQYISADKDGNLKSDSKKNKNIKLGELFFPAPNGASEQDKKNGVSKLVQYKGENINPSFRYSGEKNSQGIEAGEKTVVYKGFRFKNPRSTKGATSELIKKGIKIDEKFLSKYKNYRSGDSFTIVPEFEVKDVTASFELEKDAGGNEKGYFTGFQNVKKPLKLKALDTLSLKGVSNKGYAVKGVSQRSGSAAYSNAGVAGAFNMIAAFVHDGTLFDKNVFSLQFDSTKLKVMRDPKYKDTESIKKGKVLYIDEENKTSYSGDYNKVMEIPNVIPGKTYNIISLPEDGYRTTWRDGTLDDDENGESEAKRGDYETFSPVKGTALPFIVGMPLSRAYYSFSRIPDLGESTSITGFVKLKDRLVFTDKEKITPVNGVQITVDRQQTYTGKGGTGSRVGDGYFSISSNTFSVADYYQVNANNPDATKPFNIGFAVNPGRTPDVLVDAEKDLTLSNAKAYVVKQKDVDGKMTDDLVSLDTSKAAPNGYFMGMNNGGSKYAIDITASKYGMDISKGVLRFYDSNGTQVGGSIEGVSQGTPGSFRFTFVPKEKNLKAGTCAKVQFEDQQGHKYMERDLGIMLTQAIGVVTVANMFKVPAASKPIELIGNVNASFDLGWEGNFDEPSDIVAIDADGNTVIKLGYTRELISKEYKNDAQKLKDKAESMAKSEDNIAKANQEYKEYVDKIAKEGWTGSAVDEEVKKRKTKLEKAIESRDKNKKDYEELADKVSSADKKSVTVGGNVSFSLEVNLLVTIGTDTENGGKRYFKSMILTGKVKGSAGATIRFATPVAITVVLELGAGGTASASYVIQERTDLAEGAPRYYLPAPGLDGKTSLDIISEKKTGNDRKLDGYGAFNLSPYITLGVGAEIPGVTVMINGKAQFDINFFTTVDPGSSDVTLSAEIEVKPLGISFKKKIAQKKFNISSGSKAPQAALSSPSMLYLPADDGFGADYSYMAEESEWYGEVSDEVTNEAMDSETVESSGLIDETVIKDHVGDEPRFDMIKLKNGGYAAVFLDVPADRAADSLNAKAAYYTYYDGSKWSDPVMLEDDKTLDYDPVICDLGEHGAVAIWSSVDPMYKDTKDMIERQNAVNLRGRFIDADGKLKNEVETITKTTKDDTGNNFDDFSADLMPNVSYNDDTMVVYYEKREYSGTGTDGFLGDVLYPRYSVMAARIYSFATETWNSAPSKEELDKIKNGYQGEAAEKRAGAYTKCFYGQRFFEYLPVVSISEELTEGDPEKGILEGYWKEGSKPVITELSDSVSKKAVLYDCHATSYNDLGLFAYTLDKDGDFNTIEDRNVYMQIYDFKDGKFEHPVLITADEGTEDRNVKFVRAKEHTYLCYLSNGSIKAMDVTQLVKNYKNTLIKGKTSQGKEYYYINKTLPGSGDSVYYEVPWVLVEDDTAKTDSLETNRIGSISSFDVEAGKDHIYVMWSRFEDGLPAGVTEEANEDLFAENKGLMEEQLYTARLDLDKDIISQPVKLTDADGAHYKDAAFEVKDDGSLFGLAYKADSRFVDYEEFSRMPDAEDSEADTDYDDFVSYAVPDVETAKVISFVVEAKPQVVIENEELDEDATAGEYSPLSFCVCNKGIGDLDNLYVSARTADGESCLYEPDMTGMHLVDGVPIEKLRGGEERFFEGNVYIPPSAKNVSITIEVDTHSDPEAKKIINRELKPELQVMDVMVEGTEVRNRFRVTGTVVNSGNARADETSVAIGTIHPEDEEEVKVEHAGAYCSILEPGETYDFEAEIDVDTESEFEAVTEASGDVTETGRFYASAGDGYDETSLERIVYGEELRAAKAIKSVSINGSNGIITLKPGETISLRAAIESALQKEVEVPGSESIQITGDENLQYRFAAKDNSIFTLSEGDRLTALKSGNEELKVYVYPKNRTFNAVDNEGKENKNYEVLGSEEELFNDLPQKAIYEKNFVVSVTSEEFTVKGVRYSIPDPDVRELSVTGYDPAALPKSGKLTIPSAVTRKEEVNGKTKNVKYKVTEITGGAFRDDNKIKTVSIGGNVTSIGKEAFKGSVIKKASLGGKVSEIGEGAFEGCRELTSVNLPGKLEYLSERCFMNCSALKKITIPSKVEMVPARAFYECSSMKSAKIGKKVKYIDESAFYKCVELKSLSLGAGLEEIAVRAFLGCSSLKSVTIPKNLQIIRRECFTNCAALKNITIKSPVLSEINQDAFKGIYETAVFKVSVKKDKKEDVMKLLSEEAGVTQNMVIK